MRCQLLATLILLGAAGLAQADYVVIIIDLNAKSESSNGNSGIPGGMTGEGGMPGGIPMPGGVPPSSPGGMMGGMGYTGGYPGMSYPGMGGYEVEAEEEPYLVVAVVEGYGMAGGIRRFRENREVVFKHHWGSTVRLLKKTPKYEVLPLTDSRGRVVPSVKAQFESKYTNATRDRASADQWRELAAWALGHGLLDEFAKAMDRLAEVAPNDTAVVSYRKVKADLARPLADEDTAGLWKKRLVESYKITQTSEHHYAIVHNSPTDALTEVQSQMEQLEKTFHSFYYWWALKGVVLPVPKTRQVVILADRADEFKRLKKQLAGSTDVAASSSARREGLIILASRRNDPSYTTLTTMTSAEMWEKGYDRSRLLSARVYADGLPRDMVRETLQTKGQAGLTQLANGPRMVAMIMKAMEAEWEATSTTHQAARQLLFATGLVPRKVHVPEWLQFGMGSFFETPLQAPWGGAGSANSYWLPRFKEYRKANRYGPEGTRPVDILTKVVTDGVFRDKPGVRVPSETHIRHGRAASWALTYFLAHRELDKLRAYFKELSRMPRDLALDDKVLERCFARAFDCVNADGSVNRNKMGDLANRWLSFINDQALESEIIHREIRKFYDKMSKPAPKSGGPKSSTTPGYRPPYSTPGRGAGTYP